jgi:hypothetical protein
LLDSFASRTAIAGEARGRSPPSRHAPVLSELAGTDVKEIRSGDHRDSDQARPTRRSRSW